MNDTGQREGGCGWLLLIPLIILAIFGLVFYLVFYRIKTTEVYRCAVSEAKKNAQIIDRIGGPVTEGSFVWLDEHSSGRFSEKVHFNVSLTGPEGSGTLYVQALKDLHASSLVLIFDSGGQAKIVYSGPYPCE